MKTFTPLALCTLWLLFEPLTGFAQATFAFNIQQPATNAIVGNQVFVQVAVTSTYELQSVNANIGGVSVALAFSTATSSWSNTLSLSGMPRGLKTLTITAVDAFGNSGQAQTTVLKDLPPTLTVTEPLVGTVARPYLQLTASATDDDPVGTVISVFAGADLLVTGTNTINTAVPISNNDGQAVALRFDAVDSAGQTNTLWRTVYVLTDTNWLELARVEGPILDVSTDKILFVVGNILTTKSRLSGTETVLLNDPGITPIDGALTAWGAVFRSGIYGLTVYEVRNGALAVLDGPISANLAVQGDHAIWINWQGSLILRDLSAGTNSTVSGFAYVASLAPNGDVVYVGETFSPLYNLVFRYRNGTNSLVADGSYDYMYDSVGTDGTNIVYVKMALFRLPPPPSPWSPNYSVLSDGVTETILATNVPGLFSSLSSPVINQGWIAYSSSNSSDVIQIWTRSPGGVQTQRTFFGTSSKTRALAPNGELVFANGGHLYLVRDTPLPLDLGAWNFAAAGKVFWQQGRWYAQLGRSLFVLSRPPAISAANWAAGGQFRLVLNGNVGDTVVTQCSTNLVNWSNIATNTVTNGVFEVFAPVSPGAERMFYRAFTPVY